MESQIFSSFPIVLGLGEAGFPLREGWLVRHGFLLVGSGYNSRVDSIGIGLDILRYSDHPNTDIRFGLFLVLDFKEFGKNFLIWIVPPSMAFLVA